MSLQGLDLGHISKLISSFIDQVTCLECYRFYIAPETANCGHTFCHTCWKKCRSCPSCAAPLERRTLKLNIPVQNKTEHIHTVIEVFEKLFNVKLDEFILDVQDNELCSKDDPTKNVKNWLDSSQNHFSAPLLSSEHSTQDKIIVEQLTSKVLIHADTKKTATPKKIIHKQPPQDDWEKIEILPVSNENNNSHDPIDEHSLNDKDEYTTFNPRRSCRKKEIKNSEPSLKNYDISTDKHSSKNSSLETEIKSNNNKRNWGNVKKMRKEFSKLNKKNRNKLNVSIEMCKKSQLTTKTISKPVITTTDVVSQNYDNIIGDTTPDLINKLDQQITEKATNKIEQSTSYVGKSVPISDKNYSNNMRLEKNVSSLDTSKVLEIDKNCDNENVNRVKQSSEKSKANLSIDHPKLSFLKKSSLQPKTVENNMKTTNYDVHCNTEGNMDDIEITIKIGNTITNIFIKKKKNNMEYSLHTDKEIQTTLGLHTLSKNNNVSPNNMNDNNIEVNIGYEKEVSVVSGNTQKNNSENCSENASNIMNKSLSTKKNTASADTKTAQFEITESVEKEMSNIMECDPIDSCLKKRGMDNITAEPITTLKNTISNIKSTIIEPCLEEDDYNELDIFDSNSIKEANVQLLKSTKHTPSEILVPTIKSNKIRTQKHIDKRAREVNDELFLPNSKKIKLIDNVDDNIKTQENNELNIEAMDYDIVMGQVFSSIDADIKDTQKSKNVNETEKNTKFISLSEDRKKDLETSIHEITLSNEKFSENVFSFLEKENEVKTLDKPKNQIPSSTQQHIENLLTPGLCQNLADTNEVENVDKKLCTPVQDANDDDSDKSIVEETPQKNVSFTKPKNKKDLTHDEAEKINNSKNKCTSHSQKQVIESIVDVSDSVPNASKDTKDLTVIEALPRKTTLETPLTINRFVDHITHKSTPVARKSLNFEAENIDDIDQTLCPTTEPVAKTTQEKEFLVKAFEETPQTPIRKPLVSRNFKVNNIDNCLAGSCLSPVELAKVKLLCRQYNWKYTDKYIKDLTHLVVGVDEENRSQRSVKYMCALAASKWIVSFQWVDSCLKNNKIVKEEQYEALDGTGEPGPKRSRLAKKKLFEGMIFYCMPPFSILDVNTLKDILEAAGGRVVNEAKSVRVTGDTPALLLAEPENTQENKFIYLAMELNIVPVNHEWALNSLGSYTLSSIYELLLCPAALLPAATASWPADLVSQDCD
ncbi:putative uncharacterized protein DDB_G0282133 [Galleria mellonella]|uniref:Breast cancer type 1 susceptibility protein homolog n=1 Tax=Galleria mellonella TaxID=7137 RepID=A0A6J1WLA2_GALME|nr:putative uncharacterized protein DDB_G0282133 [Galleria mellonella]